MAQAFNAYKNDVESGTFPAKEHCVEMPDEEWEALLEEMDK
jgi:ketopantoate hydroxymethyltransferase